MRHSFRHGLCLFLLLTACQSRPLPDPPPSPAPGEPAAFAGVLDAHQRWRAAVGVPPLVWSEAAAVRAQAWADQLALQAACRIAHNPDPVGAPLWGENVYGYQRGGAYDGWRRTPTQVVDFWASERQWYDAGRHACSAPEGETCGHYTQVVSTLSSHVGCGRARCAAAEVWVCNYAPPGNYDDAAPF